MTSPGFMILWNVSLHSVNICHSAWFKKETNRPIAKQNKFRQERQTENAQRNKGRV